MTSGEVSPENQGSRQAGTAGGGGSKAGQSQLIIVVGLDGSDASSRALEWAVEEARLRGGVVKAVRVWELPVQPYEAYIPPEVYGDAAKDAAVSLQEQLTKVLGAERPVEVLSEVHEGDPAHVILDQSRDAMMIVVGSRGLGGFAGVLLGSVSSRLVHHAHCPVLVVRS